MLPLTACNDHNANAYYSHITGSCWHFKKGFFSRGLIHSSSGGLEFKFLFVLRTGSSALSDVLAVLDGVG